MYQLNIILLYSSLLVLLSWQLKDRWLLLSLIGGAVLFLLQFSPISLLILAITSVVTYYVFQLDLPKKWSVFLVLLQSLGLLFFYKAWLVYTLPPKQAVVIPLGLSFYTFRQIHYAIERYKEQIGEHDFLTYLTYLAFLPTLLVGPIHQFQPFIKNLNRRRWNANLFSEGLERILYGYAKIVIISNYLLSLKLSTLIENLGNHSTWATNYLELLNFTLITYFQFAGYSDVAIGIAYLFGFRIMENFNYPFLAKNINEFWRRWHISLSSWCRQYVYMPIASMTRKPLLGILAAMLILGLWHEVSFKYILWGAFHGVGIVIWQLFSNSIFAEKLAKIPGQSFFSIFLTFHFVLFSFVIIKADNFTAAIESYKILFGF